MRNFISDRSGTVIYIAAVLFPALVAVSAASLTMFNVHNIRGNLQSAVDSSVLAGASDMRGTANQIAVAKRYFAANLNDYSKHNVTGIETDFTIGKDGVVHGTAQASVKNPFGSAFGLAATVSVQVAAAATAAQAPLCILGLNAFDSGAFDINGNAMFRAPSCAVQMNSGSARAMTLEGHPQAAALKFGVHGGYSGSFVPAPVTGTVKIPDPYASIPFPDYANCAAGSSAEKIPEDRTLSPGTYCGGVEVSDKANVTLLPGVYVMNGGPFWIKGQSTVRGEDVMIAFTGDEATLYIYGSSTMSVTSPKSGTYANIQFMQDRSQPIPKLGAGAEGLCFTVGGNGSSDGSRLTYDGVAYLPTQNIWIYGDADVKANSPTMAIVVGKLWLQGNAKLEVSTDNPRQVATGGLPIAQMMTSARLTK